MRKWQGMNWCRQSTRLAIYLRDGLACVYCGNTIENGAILSLDHVRPHSKGGSNAANNLVTCCKHCNDARGNRPLVGWCRVVAGYVNGGLTTIEVLRKVRNAAARVLPRQEAREMIARRGSALKALKNI